MLVYLNNTIGMMRIIGARELEVLQFWVDTSFSTHRDMKSHTGGMMSLGRGDLHHRSSKQKINTCSWIEAELVGASDYIMLTIWA